MVRGLNFETLWQRGSPLGGYGVQLCLQQNIWQQKHITVKLKNGLLTNANEDADTEFHLIILRLVSY